MVELMLIEADDERSRREDGTYIRDLVLTWLGLTDVRLIFSF